MPISCVTNGNPQVWKSMEQKIYIGTMFLILFFMILSPILSLVLYDVFNGYVNDLCKNYGIDLKEDDAGAAIISLSVLSIVSGVLFLLSVYYYFNAGASNLDYITPLILFIICVLSAVGAGLLGGDDESSDTGVADPKIREWCYNSRSGASNIRNILGIILAVSIAVFIAYLTTLLGKSCKIY